MKFISKYQKFMVVLRPGQPGNRALGTQAIPGLFVKFIDSEAEINENDPRGKEMIELLMNHPAYINKEIISADNPEGLDIKKQSSEPGHDISEFKYGHLDKTLSSPSKSPLSLSPEQKKLFDEAVKAEAKKLVEGFLASKKESTEEVKKTASIDPTMPANGEVYEFNGKRYATKLSMEKAQRMYEISQKNRKNKEDKLEQ